MDSSNAEKAWKEHVAAAWDRLGNTSRDTFMAGRASRDAEVAALTAENERLEAQIAKGGAIVQKAADLALTTPFSLQQATESLTWTTDVWHQFKKAEADRDAALKALAESRARFADSEARRAELEAVRENVRALVMSTDGDYLDGSSFDGLAGGIQAVILAVPSVVLEDRDREVAARTIDEFADLQERTTKLHAYAMDEDDWDEHKRLVTCLRNYSALIRKGDTNA